MAAYDPSGEIELALDPNAVPVLSASAPAALLAG